VQVLCKALAVPPSTYYYQPHRADDVEVREAIEEVAVEFPRYGYQRVSAELERRGWQINHKRVHRLMQEANLMVEVRSYCQTTNSKHSYGCSPNLIKRLEIVRPDQVWSAASYHKAYARKALAVIIIPAYLAMLLSIVLVFVHPDAVPLWSTFVIAALGIVLLVETFAIEVPRHLKLEKARDQAILDGQVKTNWIRTVAFTAQGLLALWMVTQAFSPR